MLDISFCITCMGRLHHLERTLPINLQAIEPHKAEIILLNYNSQDGLDDWVNQNLQAEIEAGILKYFKTNKPKYFNASHAKNVSHRQATGNIVCNLDADNFTSQEQINALMDTFAKQPTVTVGKTSYGRIALLRDHFMAMRGYDEDFTGWGVEDIDLVDRASKLFGCIHQRLITDHIEHSDEERICLGPPLPTEGFSPVEKWIDEHPIIKPYATHNRYIQRRKQKLGNHLIANLHREWGDINRDTPNS